jgi:hypothetical protein
VEDKAYVNPFVEVHRKAEAFKDRLREANENEDELRERRAMRVAKEALDKQSN